MKKIVLNKETVLEIANLLKNSELSYDFLSAKFNLGKDQISMINTGKRYSEFLQGEDYPLRKKAVSKPKKSMLETRLSDNDLLEILTLLKEGIVKYDDIASKYNVNRQTIVQINSGKFSSPIKEKFDFPVRTKHIRQKKGVSSLKLTDEQLFKIVKLLKDKKLTFEEIGEKFGVSSWTISQINNGHKHFETLKDEDFPIRKEQIRPKVGVNSLNSKLSEDDIVQIINILKEEKTSMRAIGKLFDIDSSSIMKMNKGQLWKSTTSKYVDSYPIRNTGK